MRLILSLILFLLCTPLQANTRDNLIGWWALDDGIGTSAIDSSGKGNTGTLNAGTALVVNCKRDKCVNFDGAGGSITAAFAFNLGTYSASVWIKPNSVVGFRRIVSDSGNAWSVLLNDNKLAQLVNANGEYATTSSTAIVANVWTHIVVVKNLGSSTTNFYINGVLDATTVSSSADPNTSTNIVIGLVSGSQYFSGMIDDIRIYNRVLTAQEAGDLYNAGGYLNN